jgi:ASCH domain-containing protein
MKALTIHQPWAWAILNCGKTVENRSWATSYRGPLLIHAGRKIVPAEHYRHLFEAPADLPLGAVIEVVELVDCIRNASSAWAVAGLWHWVIRNPRVFAKPIPARGNVGIFELEVTL